MASTRLAAPQRETSNRVICYRAQHDFRSWGLAISSAVLPDADVIGFALGINVSPMGVRSLFSRWGAVVLLSEMQYVWVPLLLIWFMASLLRKTLTKPD
jgi:hypothetical protein